MGDVNSLVSRIEGAFSSVKDRIKQEQQRGLQYFQERQKLLKEYERVRAEIIAVARPRLEALAERAGDRVKVTPVASESRRSAALEFRGAKAHILLTFSVAPDRDLKNAVVEYDLQIVPVLWKFDKHAEFSTPVAAPDLDALGRWLDDRIVGFVELYIQIHEGELYDKAEYVEDPIAGVKFPKFAAGASLECDGRTVYFIDDKTRDEFAQRERVTTA